MWLDLKSWWADPEYNMLSKYAPLSPLVLTGWGFCEDIHPQRVLKNTFFQKDKSAAQRAILKRVSLKGKRPFTKIGRQWRSKRGLMGQIRALEGLGRFQAENFWRFYSMKFKTYPRHEQHVRRHWPWSQDRFERVVPRQIQ